MKNIYFHFKWNMGTGIYWVWVPHRYIYKNMKRVEGALVHVFLLLLVACLVVFNLDMLDTRELYLAAWEININAK